MDPDFDSPDPRASWRSRYHAAYPPFFDASYPSCFHLLPCHKTDLSTCRKAHRIPVEIFSEIFLYTVQVDPRSQENLMLVCRHWRNIMLSTPGIHSQLRIMWSTRKKDVERLGRRWLLDVTVDMTVVFQWFKPDPVEFNACFMAAAEAASRWRKLVLVLFPPPEEYKDLQIMHPLQHLESFRLAASCNLGNFLEPLITAIMTTVTTRFTVMEVFHPDAALFIVQSAHFKTFSSLTILRLNCRRMQNPVDILPFLHRVEIFEAHHLSLPIYSPGVDLALTRILRVLSLKSVSIQWIAGRVFPALEECSIIFPHHADAIQSVFMPSCSILKYDSNNLRTLEHFHHPPLARLEVKCGQWRTWRGNLQLAALHCIFAAQTLTCLHLEIKCGDRLLSYMLGHVPGLEELWMGLSSPHALSSAFFLAFAALGCNASAGPSSQTISPLCRQLRRLHLHYKRWSRGAERNELIPAFGAIVASHPPEEHIFSFQLSFSEGPELQEWIIHEPVERFDVELESSRTFIGASSPHGVIPLSRAYSNGHYLLTELEGRPLPRESEYITTHERLELPIQQFLSFHGLKEVRADMLSLKMGSNTQSSPNAPLFHTLTVLSIFSAPFPFLAGQTFHNLERFKEEDGHFCDDPGQNMLTEMPVCTRLVVPLSRLATLKLPQVCELGVLVDHKDFNYIWENHVAVNANLSGLKLLHLRVTRGYSQLPITEIIKILRSLPALETLVLEGRYLVGRHVNLFEAFVPSDVPRTSGLNQSSWESQISGVLCPRLESLWIEDIRLNKESKIMPVLKDIVTLRAIICSPLKSFTFYHWNPKKKWELIGRDGGFNMERVVPAVEFQLDI
jgi:hypothetical protein